MRSGKKKMFDSIWLGTGNERHKNLRCRHCKRRVEIIEPEFCPHCHKIFETREVFLFRIAAYGLVILTGIYLWQKIILGLF